MDTDKAEFETIEGREYNTMRGMDRGLELVGYLDNRTVSLVVLLAILVLTAGGCQSTTAVDNEMDSANFHSMWDYNDAAGSEAKFRALLVDVTSGDDESFRAEVLTQIARAQGLQRQFDDAHKTLDQAEALVDRDKFRARVRLRLLLERGRVFNSSGEADKAKPLFVEAWELASREGIDGLAVDAAHMIGVVATGKEALKWNQQALELANVSADPDAQRWKGSLCNNIGWTYHTDGDYDTALSYFEQALEHRIEQGKADELRIARWCVARCLRSLARVEEALAIQRELEQEIADLENPDGYVYEELAECLHALGRSDEAKSHFRRAHELLSKDPWFVENEKKRIERLAELAGISQ